MISGIINELVSRLEPRQKQIISGRFGLEDGEKQTLASLGDRYNITRERVRQIETEALKNLRIDSAREKLESIVKKEIFNHLDSLGGLRKDDIFLYEIKSILKDEGMHHWHLRFLSEMIGEPYYYEPDEEFHFFWYRDKDSAKKVKKFFSEFERSIRNKREELVVHGKFEEYFKQIITRYGITESIGINYLSVSKKFSVSPFGDFGLSEWEEINPKTIRDRAYLVLKKQSVPMHFRGVADSINAIVGGEDKRALPQTVHNELIKDPRIVLVGRGIYALKDGGYAPGSTKDLIRAILKENGPLHPKEIVDLVKRQRILKDNTILLSIQNKKHFKKLPDGKIAV